MYITRLASNEIFSPSNKIHQEVGRAKDVSAPWYMCIVDSSSSSSGSMCIADSNTVACRKHKGVVGWLCTKLEGSVGKLDLVVHKYYRMLFNSCT
jgi:hypothetical protein